MKRILIIGSFPEAYASELNSFAKDFFKQACRRNVGVSTHTAWPDTFDEAVTALKNYRPDIVVLYSFELMRDGNGLEIALWIDKHMPLTKVCVSNLPEDKAKEIFAPAHCAKTFRNNTDDNRFIDSCLGIKAKALSAA